MIIRGCGRKRPSFELLQFLCCFVSDFLVYVSGLECGYPGSPAYGRPSPVRERYLPGHSVGFTCALGYTLRGNLQRTCLLSGSWSGQVPICDQSLSAMEQHASSRATLELYAASKAIDGDRDTCTYTDKRRPRWVRVDLRKPHVVQAVAVTVPKNMYKTDNAHFTIYVISVKDSTTAAYHKCADFNGKFSTQTVKLPCAGGGIFGSYVHIEDNRNTVDYFSACEIEIFVQRDSYDCGEVDQPANSYTTNPEAGIVQYKCMHGYQLVGSARRHCLSNGQWSGSQPICKEIVCPLLDDVAHGTMHYIGPTRGRPVQGTTANITCDYGFHSNGTVLHCLETGQWSEGQLVCQPIDCRAPKLHNNMVERFVLLNGSTTYGSMAFLYCADGEVDEQRNVTVECREDGSWSSSSVDCVTNNMISTLGLVEEESTVPNGVIIGMAVVVFFLLVILILILLLKRKQLMRRHSAESIPSKDTSSSFGNCPSSSNEHKQGLPYENDAFYASIAFNDNKPEQQKQQTVQRGILSTILFSKRKQERAERSAATNGPSGSKGIHEAASNNSKSKTKEQASDTEEENQPVYAQVDYHEKRRSRLAKSLTEQLDCSEATDLEEQIVCREFPAYESELDTEESIKLRALPPIPDDDHSSGTYASLSKPPEPPPVMRDNNIYVRQDTPCCQQFHCHSSVMKDNALYSAG